MIYDNCSSHHKLDEPKSTTCSPIFVSRLFIQIYDSNITRNTYSTVNVGHDKLSNNDIIYTALMN